MPNYPTQPRILFVTAEVAFVPARAGNRPDYIGACWGCFGDFPAELINDLLNLGVDVHVAQPDYRKARLQNVLNLTRELGYCVGNFSHQQLPGSCRGVFGDNRQSGLAQGKRTWIGRMTCPSRGRNK